MTPSWKEYRPCRALAVPSSPLFAYKAIAVVDEDEVCTSRRQWDVFLRVVVADLDFKVVMQFRERAWLWSSEWLKDMLDFIQRMVESARDVVFSLLPAIINRARRVRVCWILVGTRYFPVRAFAAVLCTVLIDWSRASVVGWYPSALTT